MCRFQDYWLKRNIKVKEYKAQGGDKLFHGSLKVKVNVLTGSVLI
jgi:hypothetical protein